ncbi:cellulose synthase-like protein D1-like protein [Corchorus capsularis]|uniref:Cellulose synthase-like protein D1-like protein n=1 Tax=Corchorus capsularis TaxID=210143 RepID=A0A1R3JYG2_COCAP|nr:cellulose synthase-like protein D1-like protein [Corchorus capsularis]
MATSKSSSNNNAKPPQAVKFARRTASGRVMSLSRDLSRDDMDITGDMSNQNDYINYTVLMPPTPDNQPGSDSGPSSDSKSEQGTSRFASDSQRMSRRAGEEDGGGGDGQKLDRRMSILNSSNNKSMLLRSQTGDFDHNRWLFESKARYGIGNAYWQNDDDDNQYGTDGGVTMSDFMDKPWKPLTRKIKERDVCSGVMHSTDSIHRGQTSIQACLGGSNQELKQFRLNHIQMMKKHSP